MNADDRNRILHILRNIATKDLVVIHNLETILTTLKSKKHDHDEIWDIVKGETNGRMINDRNNSTANSDV